MQLISATGDMVIGSARPTGRNSRQLLWVLGLSLGILLGACSWIPKGASELDVGIEDRGVASWYGESLHGKQAANGELFDMEALTAAHRTLSLGSIVRVVNLANGKHLYVRITDRGPYVNNRILDLSRGAAVRLGMLEGGLSVVRVQLVGERQPAALLSSEAMETVSIARILGLEQASLRGHRAPLLSLGKAGSGTGLSPSTASWRYLDPATCATFDGDAGGRSYQSLKQVSMKVPSDVSLNEKPFRRWIHRRNIFGNGESDDRA